MDSYIDIHNHFNHGAKGDHILKPFVQKEDIPFLREQAFSMGVKKVAFAGSLASVLHTQYICEENEFLYRFALENDWVYQWVVVDPRNKETLEQADKMLDSPKCLGIKLHPVYHGWDAAKYAEQIFSFAAERKAIVLIHPDKIPEISAVAGRFFDMKLILAHLGGEEWVNALARYENVYADTSGGASFSNNIIEWTVESVGSDKLLFGADTYSFAAHLGRIRFAQISDADKDNILFRNALKLFKKLN